MSLVQIKLASASVASAPVANSILKFGRSLTGFKEDHRETFLLVKRIGASVRGIRKFSWGPEEARASDVPDLITHTYGDDRTLRGHRLSSVSHFHESMIAMDVRAPQFQLEIEGITKRRAWKRQSKMWKAFLLWTDRHRSAQDGDSRAKASNLSHRHCPST